MERNNDDLRFENQTIIDVDLNGEMRKSFLDYSMSVITSRALPDVRDGLKPVHRRILYTMHENSLYPDKPYRKCADTVGSVLGRYHPHGDASVYDAMVRLAQKFSTRYILVDGHGNFGSVDGDPPAAYRYTESRMSKISMEMLTDIDKETVDFVPNYDDRLKEPTVLPSRFPNLLVNGSTGIAVGMATNIPPHNLGEVIDGMCCLIDDPDAPLEKIMEYIKGPDFPTAGIVMGKSGIRAAYGTGRGKITVRARTEIVENKNGRFSIVVSELPYQVNKRRLIEAMADLVKDKRIEGISDINDYSNRQGMHLVIDLKREANPQVVLNTLFSMTQLQITYGIIMLALVDGVPRILTLRQILEHYIKFQEEVVSRRTRYDLRKAKEREHILEGLKTALDFIDEIIAILRKAKDQNEGKAALMERFNLDDIQADAIVKMRLGQLTGLERIKIENELKELCAKIAEYEGILADERKVLAIVKNEALELKRRYADERLTEIAAVSGEVDIEDLIPEEQCVYTLTTFGYIKRIPASVYTVQKKGGKGVKGMSRREEDVAQTMFTCSSHDYIMFFTTKGRAYRLKGYEIPEGSRQSKGMNVVNLLPVEADEKISAMIRVPDFGEEEKYLCMVTRNGIIKRTELDAYKNIRKSGIIAINLDEGDELAWVWLTNGNDDILVATKNGFAIRFNENDARAIGRTARGVRAIDLRGGDCVVGMCAISKDDEENGAKILTVSESGIGRRSALSDYHLQSRAGKGSINYKTEKYGLVAAVCLVHPDDDLILISSDGIVIRIDSESVNAASRTSRGVNVMRTSEGEKVVSVTAVKREEESESTDNDGGTENAESDEEM
ncbi:MAG: DNA gyrase subunit A [Clostridiaceae bacterium]|nr:DNA gyrase subunit A [Clostridiaceae bacterium]MDY5990656.1 DNA gyrase subunit A [Oscillospiraceae bacterium]